MKFVKYGAKKFEEISAINASHIIRGGTLITLGQFVASSSSFLLALIFANLIPKELYGNYKYLLTVLSLVTIATLPAITGPTAHTIAEGSEGSLFEAMKLRIKFGIIGSAALILISLYFFLYAENSWLGYGFLIAAPFVPIMDPLGMYSTYLQAKNHFKKATIYFVISQIISITLMISAALLTKNILAIFATYLITWTALRFYFFKKTIRELPPNTKTSDKLFTYGIHLNALSVLNQVATYADSFLLFHYLGPIEVAIYSVCIAPAEQIRSMIKDVPTYALPHLIKRNVREINAVLKKRLVGLFLLGAAISILSAVVLHFLFPVFFKQYQSYTYLAILYTPTLFLRTPLILFSSLTQSRLTNMNRSWFNYTIIPNIILITSLLILTPLYGIIGVIAARYINIICMGIVTIFQWKLIVKKEMADT